VGSHKKRLSTHRKETKPVFKPIGIGKSELSGEADEVEKRLDIIQAY